MSEEPRVRATTPITREQANAIRADPEAFGRAFAENFFREWRRTIDDMAEEMARGIADEQEEPRGIMGSPEEG